MTGPAGQAGLRRFVRPPGTPLRPGGEAAAGATGRAPVITPDAIAAMGALPGQQARPGPADVPERCELCAAEIPAEHSHIADLDTASLQCACRACYLLFTQKNAGRGRYAAVPDRYLSDPARPMAPSAWDQLEVPVGLAFFLRTSRQDGALTGFYPSPAGATECRLDLSRWERLVAEYPLLGAPLPDVEAALISRADSGVEYYLVPVDICYALAGRMRLTWRGFDGGTQARESIAAFLAVVRERARPFTPPVDHG